MFSQNALIAETEKLQKFALRLTKNASDADDLVQSTCLRALEKSHLFQEGTNLFSWASKVMFNIFVTNYRRQTNFETRFDPEIYINRQVVAPTQDIIAELENVKRAMMHLSSDHREVLVMIGVQGMRYEEVSVKLHIPVGTVRSRLSRAREHLQTILDTPSVQAAMQEKVPEQSANENITFVPAYIAARTIQKRRACR